MVDGGDAWVWKECAHCTAFIRLYDLGESRDGEGYGRDSVSDAAQDLPNYNLGPLSVRHAAQYLMGWTTRSGMLVPIPEPG